MSALRARFAPRASPRSTGVWATCPVVDDYMSIFISYASVDRERAKLVAKALERRGWSVWWDRTIPPGKEYDQVIEEALDSAKCVVVLWSRASVASTWVKTESAEAMRRKILVPALIEEVKIPLEFRRLQAADLSHWRGESDSDELVEFFQSIDANIRGIGETGRDRDPAAPPPPAVPTLVARPRLAKRHLWASVALILVVVAVSGVTLWRRDQPGGAGPGPAQEGGRVAAPAAAATARPVDVPVSVGQPHVAHGAVVTQPTTRAATPVPTAQRPTGGTPSKPVPLTTPTTSSAQPTTSPSPTSGSASPSPVTPVEPAAPPARPEPSREPATPSLGASAPPPSEPTSTPSPPRPAAPPRQFAVVLQIINTDGEAEQLDALLLFDNTGLVVKDEDSTVVRTLPYSSVQKATYRRAERRIGVVGITITRHWLTLAAGREEVVLLMPGDTHLSILSEVEQRIGTTVRRVD
jgi:TIR domain